MTPRKSKPPKRSSYTYKYARKALMVDAVVLGLRNEKVKILLVLKDFGWALPGGHVTAEESVEEAIHRELFEETNVRGAFLEQFHTFSEVDRDPREPTASVAFRALVRPEDLRIQAGTGASVADWYELDSMPRLAFDHASMVAMGIERIRQEIWERPIVGSMLPRKFTLPMVHDTYQKLLDQDLDPKNFRRDFLKRGFLEEASPPAGMVRPPTFYRFK